MFVCPQASEALEVFSKLGNVVFTIKPTIGGVGGGVGDCEANSNMVMGALTGVFIYAT